MHVQTHFDSPEKTASPDVEKRVKVVYDGPIDIFLDVQVCHAEKAAVDKQEQVSRHALPNKTEAAEVRRTPVVRHLWQLDQAHG